MNTFTINKKKIYTQIFFKQYIWLIIPLCVFGNIISCSAYIEAGSHLTPKTVYVTGYSRSDGTHIDSYYRRPPGGAIHDAPYERKRMIMTILFLGCLVFGAISIVNYIDISKRQIKKEINRFEEIEKQKRKEEKSKLLEDILGAINFDFEELLRIPSRITLNKGFKCKLCEKNIGHYECHIEFKARTNFHHVCIDCAKKYRYIGISQPITDFVNELAYMEMYKTKMNEFIKVFLQISSSGKYIFEEYELKTIFIKELMAAITR